MFLRSDIEISNLIYKHADRIVSGFVDTTLKAKELNIHADRLVSGFVDTTLKAKELKLASDSITLHLPK